MINIEIERCTPEEQSKRILEAYTKKCGELAAVTVPKLLEEVANDFCDNYCKWPEQWNEKEEGCELCESEICATCPINKLT